MNDFRALEALASNESFFNVPGFSAANEDIQAAYEEQLAEERKQAAKDAAAEIVVVLKKVGEHSRGMGREIRQYKHYIEDSKKISLRRDKAHMYAMETNNYLPLAHIVGVRYDPNARVPEDWSPSEETKKKFEAIAADLKKQEG